MVESETSCVICARQKWTVVGMLPPLLVSAGVSAVLFLPLLRNDAMSAWGYVKSMCSSCRGDEYQ
jgi:hypothetical protein